MYVICQILSFYDRYISVWSYNSFVIPITCTLQYVTLYIKINKIYYNFNRLTISETNFTYMYIKYIYV